MKKMLDELRKLEEEHNAPVSFKKNVMSTIRAIEEEKQHPHSKFAFQKYVITSLATAAVIVLACVVTWKTGKINTKESASTMRDEVIDASAMLATEIPETVEENSMVYESSKMMVSAADMSVSNSAFLEDDNVKSRSMPSFAMNESVASAGIRQEDASEDAWKENSIIMVLKKNEIEILEEGDNFVIVNSSIKEVQSVLQELENEEESELTFEILESGNVKITY